MHPADDPKSLKATQKILTDGTLPFDLSSDGPHLIPFQYRYHYCL